jgi:archaellum component FlaC
MEEILKAIQQLEEKFDNRFEKLDKKFDLIEEKFELIDNKFEKKFDKVTSQLDRMETTINNVSKTANQDTNAILKIIDTNTKNINRDIEFLSELSGKHEMYFNRMSKN